jgi:hypothetical protein
MKSTIKKLTADQLTIPTEVGTQRVEGVDHRRITRMAADFKPHLLATITASERTDGTVVVLDGAHRTTLCRTVGYTKPLNVEVFVGATIAEEAQLFLGRNDNKLVSAISKFQSRVTAGDPVACDIKSLCDEHGWTIGVDSLPGFLAAVDALERVYRNAGGVLPDGEHHALTDRVLATITVAWEWDRKSSDASILLALAQLFGRVGASVDSKKLIAEMQATRPGVMIGKAKALRDAQGGTVPAAMAKLLTSMHNNKRRTNLLPEWVWVR